MKKIGLALLSLSTIIVLNVQANDGWNKKTKSNSYNYQVQESNFENWVEKNTKPKQYFGIGYNEEGLGISYGVNTSFGIYDTEETNFYSFVDYANNRITISEGYDVLNNQGLQGLQLIPFVGLSVDTSSAKVGTFVGIRTRYSVMENLGMTLGYKYYLSKPIEGSGDTKETKDYVFGTIDYQF